VRGCPASPTNVRFGSFAEIGEGSGMSALPPEADMLIVGINVCYVPEADTGKNIPASQGAS
jgi:hypothetical protein